MNIGNAKKVYTQNDPPSPDRRRSRISTIALYCQSGPANSRCHAAGPPPGNSSSALASPSTPASTSGGWSADSAGGGTVCYGDERAMLSELGRRFYNRRALSDVKLRVGERVYRCHKLLLALASDVLERMLCCADWTDAAKQARSCTSRASQ